MSQASAPRVSPSTLPWYHYQAVPDLPQRPWAARSRPLDVCTTYSTYSRSNSQLPSRLRVPLSVYTSGLTHSDTLNYNRGHLGPSISLPNSPRGPMGGLTRPLSVAHQPRSGNEPYIGLHPNGNSMHSLLGSPSLIPSSDPYAPYCRNEYTSRHQMQYYSSVTTTRGQSNQPPPALVRTIVRMHAHEPVAGLPRPLMYSPAHQPRTDTASPPPPALPARSRKHGARRSATCMTSSTYTAATITNARRFVPLLSPDLLRRSYCPSIQPHSDPLRDPPEQNARAKRSAFNLESHLDCSCDYVRADPGLWPAAEWYERNFHTVDRCTCPHEEVHRYFDDAASTWKLADTIAMLPIRETDILDDLVDSTSEEEESELNRPIVEDVTHSPRNVAVDGTKHESLNIVTGVGASSDTIKSMSNMAYHRSATEEDDMVTLGQMLTRNEALVVPDSRQIGSDGCSTPEQTEFTTPSRKVSHDNSVIAPEAHQDQTSSRTSGTTKQDLQVLEAPNGEKLNEEAPNQAVGPRRMTASGGQTDSYVQDKSEGKHKFPSQFSPTTGYEDIDQFNNGMVPPSRSRTPTPPPQQRPHPRSTDETQFGSLKMESVASTLDQTYRVLRDTIENGMLDRIPSVGDEAVSEEQLDRPVETDTEMREAESDLDLNEWLAGSHDTSDSEYLPDMFDDGPVDTKATPTAHWSSPQIDKEHIPDERPESQPNWNMTARTAPEGYAGASQPSTMSSQTLSQATLPRRHKSVRDEFEARQRALKRWAMLSAHVNEMAIKVSS
ncbi:unnamed protein product [Echinostoma caproni]|uniref:RING-type domain-containing protein n=1 Tax=Echinostoma caproni TaxID=27848 RepID=A0A183ADN2_9TREM|nr:unnamed protein product [Echinostoma caproni]